MTHVYIVFRLNEFDERVLWRVFDAKEKASEWINEHGTWSKFVCEKYGVNL